MGKDQTQFWTKFSFNTFIAPRNWDHTCGQSESMKSSWSLFVEGTTRKHS